MSCLQLVDLNNYYVLEHSDHLICTYYLAWAVTSLGPDPVKAVISGFVRCLSRHVRRLQLSVYVSVFIVSSIDIIS